MQYSVPGWSEWVGQVIRETLHLGLVAKSDQPKTEEPGRHRRAPECGAKCGGQKEKPAPQARAGQHPGDLGGDLLRGIGEMKQFGDRCVHCGMKARH